MKKIGFIGVGNMASAIIGGCIESSYITASNVYGYDAHGFKLDSKYLIQNTSSAKELINAVDIVVFSIKPNVVESVIKDCYEELKGKAVVSIVAGYLFERYNGLLDASTRHLSIMPNTPALVNQGMTLFEKDHSLTNEEYDFINKMFCCIGSVETLPAYLMSAGGAISGCGPAFFYMMIEALGDAGVLAGLPRDVAYTLASQTMIGSGMMQLQTKTHPGVLKDQVCSPGGITIKGVQSLEENGFRHAVIDAIKKAQ